MYEGVNCTELVNISSNGGFPERVYKPSARKEIHSLLAGNVSRLSPQNKVLLEKRIVA
jgi:hypothetical protein